MTILQDEILDRVLDIALKEANKIRLLLGIENDRDKTPREAIHELIMERDALILQVQQLMGPERNETRFETIERLKREIGVRQSELTYLVLGDPRISVSDTTFDEWELWKMEVVGMED